MTTLLQLGVYERVVILSAYYQVNVAFNKQYSKVVQSVQCGRPGDSSSEKNCCWVLLVTDVSTTWAEVIFRVKWKVVVNRWCYKSGPLKLIGQLSRADTTWKSRLCETQTRLELSRISRAGLQPWFPWKQLNCIFHLLYCLLCYLIFLAD